MNRNLGTAKQVAMAGIVVYNAYSYENNENSGEHLVSFFNKKSIHQG
jgi:hypothetical protein